VSDIDWGEIDSELDDIVGGAKKKTDDELAARVSSLTRLTDAEVKELFPKPADVQKLAQLMQIVRSAESRNTKINQLVENAESLAGTVLTLVGKFA
jgi:hypothetical protein